MNRLERALAYVLNKDERDVKDKDALITELLTKQAELENRIKEQEDLTNRLIQVLSHARDFDLWTKQSIRAINKDKPLPRDH